MFQFIQHQNELNRVLDVMGQCSQYGLDTEFIKVDTFRPKLGVMQINVNGEIFLLDGTCLDLSQFWEKIYQVEQNIFHACSEDVDLIYYYAQSKNLRNIFDTQVGMSFLGYGLQASYQNALKEILQVDIQKDQTRSDWLARPLSDDQLNYAANDVIYIMRLANAIKTQLDQKGLYQYVLEDCQHLCQEIAAEVETDRWYAEVGNYRHSPKQLMQLQQLCIWREQLVKALNLPRSFVLKNSSMIDLVERNPKNIFQLSQTKDIRASIVREHGKTIMDLLRYLPTQDQWPLRIARPIKHSSKGVTQSVDQLILQVSQRIDVPKEVLMRKKWLNMLYQHVVFNGKEQDLPDYLLGWRYDQLTYPLICLLNKDMDFLSTQMKVMT